MAIITEGYSGFFCLLVFLTRGNRNLPATKVTEKLQCFISINIKKSLQKCTGGKSYRKLHSVFFISIVSKGQQQFTGDKNYKQETTKVNR